MTKNGKSGYTIMEFLFVTLIFVIAIIMVLQIFVSFNKDSKVLMGYLNSYLKGREIIDLISKDCRMGIRVMDSYDGYVTSDDLLVLKVPSLDSAGNILDINNEFDYIIYDIEDGDLWKTVIPGSNSSRLASSGILKKSAGSLYVTSYGTPLSSIPHKSTITALTLRITISETVMGKEYTVTPGTTVKLMNYEWEFVR